MNERSQVGAFFRYAWRGGLLLTIGCLVWAYSFAQVHPGFGFNLMTGFDPTPWPLIGLAAGVLVTVVGFFGWLVSRLAMS